MDLRWRGFPDGSEGKASACNARDPALIPGLEKALGEGNGNPLWYSCLENPMDRGASWATVHRVTKSRTRLSSPFLFRGARMRRQQEARAQFGISCPRAPLSPRAPSASTPAPTLRHPWTLGLCSGPAEFPVHLPGASSYPLPLLTRRREGSRCREGTPGPLGVRPPSRLSATEDSSSRVPGQQDWGALLR